MVIDDLEGNRAAPRTSRRKANILVGTMFVTNLIAVTFAAANLYIALKRIAPDAEDTSAGGESQTGPTCANIQVQNFLGRAVLRLFCVQSFQDAVDAEESRH